MAKDNHESQFDWGLSLSFGALVGVLAAAIVGMLRLSKPKKEGQLEKSSTTLSTSESSAGLQDRPAAHPVADSGKQVAVLEDGQIGGTHWSTGTKYFVAALLFLGILGILYISSGSISTIVFAALLTFIVHPIIKYFQRRFKMRRGGATLMTYVLVLALLFLLPFLIVPSIVEAISFFTEIDYLALIQSAGDWLQNQAAILENLPFVGSSLSSSLEELARILNDAAAQNPQANGAELEISFQNIGGRISQTLAFLGKVVGPLVAFVMKVIFVLLISLHMSLSIELLRDASRRLIPDAYEAEIRDLFRRLIVIWQSFLRGQMSLMVIMGLLVWFGNLILGTPQALLLGVLAGLLEVIPSLGPLLATIPAVILALLFGSTNLAIENWAFALFVIAFYLLIQVVENQLLVPYILGDAVDLPPLFVIIGVVIGGSAFGLLGVFLATPVISSGREIFMYLYDKILEPPPGLEIEEEKPDLMESLRALAARLPRPKWRRKDGPPVALPEEAPAAEQG